jgi:hypothetical protein
MKRIVLQVVNGVVRNGQIDLVRGSMAEVVRPFAPRLYSGSTRPTAKRSCGSAYRPAVGLVAVHALRSFLEFALASAGLDRRQVDMQTGRTQCDPVVTLRNFSVLANFAG